MADLATITRRVHDTGFEQGSVAAANVIFAWLYRNDLSGVAAAAVAAWNDGTIGGQPEASPAAPAATSASSGTSPTDLGPPKINRGQAKSMGFTGNSCTHCGSLQLVQNGTCEKCTACGETTGCS